MTIASTKTPESAMAWETVFVTAAMVRKMAAITKVLMYAMRTGERH
jgi:hypothetical protein